MKRFNVFLMLMNVCLTIVLLSQFQYPAAVSASLGASPGTSSESIDIVYIIDVSGSTADTDSGQYAKDALKLGIDLAPSNSRVAVIAVNSAVVSETDLIDVSVKEGRDRLKRYVDQLEIRGNTDFTPGYERAVGILESSNANIKQIFFLGDFSEGGYNAGAQDQEIEAASSVYDIAERAKTGGIIINNVFWEKEPQDSIAAPAFLELPQATGGRLIEISDTKLLPASIEDIYFDSFMYLYTITDLNGEDSQTLDVLLPTNSIRRARVYVSAHAPVRAFRATYAGVNLESVHNRSYSLIDLANPAPEGINLTFTPGATDITTICTILEYDPLVLSVSLENVLEKSENEKSGTNERSGTNGSSEIQVSTINAEIVDAKTGKPLLTAPYPADAVYTVTIASPRGPLPISYDPATPTAYSFTPDLQEEFGLYHITGELTVEGISFGLFTASVDVPDIRPGPVAPGLRNWLLIAAVIVCGILIMVALNIAQKIRKSEVEYKDAVELTSDYTFHGKLSVYALVLDGGDSDIRPFDYALHAFNGKRITLRDILDSVGATDAYAGAEGIMLMVGPEESLVLRNNSKAIIKSMGRSHEFNSKLQLFYGQKIYIVFEKDENELEIAYKKNKPGSNSSSIAINLRSERTVTKTKAETNTETAIDK